MALQASSGAQLVHLRAGSFSSVGSGCATARIAGWVIPAGPEVPAEQFDLHSSRPEGSSGAKGEEIIGLANDSG